MHSATLVAITPDAENLISYCARVSNPANQENYDTAPKLLRYCAKHGHWSVMEMANMVVEIKTTRSVAAQIIRHRSFSFQEFSQRYAEVLTYPVLPDLRRQDKKNRQNSIDDLSDHDVQHYQTRIQQVYVQAQEVYTDMLKAGIAKECAREVLPMSSRTTIYMNGTIRSWIHYLNLRTDPATQLEHRLVAESIKGIFTKELPIISEAIWN